MAELPATRKAALPHDPARSLHPLLLAAWQVLRSMFQAALKTAHLLWLEVTGLLFLVLAAVGGLAAVREYQAYIAGNAGPLRTLAAAAFTLMFGWFGVNSFWRARRRSPRTSSHG